MKNLCFVRKYICTKNIITISMPNNKTEHFTKSWSYKKLESPFWKDPERNFALFKLNFKFLFQSFDDDNIKNLKVLNHDYLENNTAIDWNKKAVAIHTYFLYILPLYSSSILNSQFSNIKFFI